MQRIWEGGRKKSLRKVKFGWRPPSQTAENYRYAGASREANRRKKYCAFGEDKYIWPSARNNNNAFGEEEYIWPSARNNNNAFGEEEYIWPSAKNNNIAFGEEEYIWPSAKIKSNAYGEDKEKPR